MIVLAALAGIALGAVLAIAATRRAALPRGSAGRAGGRRRSWPRRRTPGGAGRIALLVPGRAPSAPALEAALRLARAQDATLVPLYVATVPRRLPFDAALPRQAALAVDVLEALEVRGARAGVAVDTRIARGRTARHAIAEALAREPADRLVVPAGEGGGLGPGDVAWLLDHVEAELVILRPRLDA